MNHSLIDLEFHAPNSRVYVFQRGHGREFRVIVDRTGPNTGKATIVNHDLLKNFSKAEESFVKEIIEENEQWTTFRMVKISQKEAQ
jgi:hypothetical protein